MKILYAEDDADDQEMVAQALADINTDIQCFTVENGTEAIQLLKNRIVTPNLILLDLNMPVMGGKECLIELKKDKSFLNIPVVIYSTSNNSEEINELYALGAEEFMSKPTSVDVLYKQLKTLVNKFDKPD